MKKLKSVFLTLFCKHAVFVIKARIKICVPIIYHPLRQIASPISQYNTLNDRIITHFAFDLFNAFHDFENDFFGENALQSFKTDIKDEGDKYVMEAELPGFDKDDIKLDISGNDLVLTAEHKAETEDKKDKYIRRERTYGSYQRSFDLTGIDTNNIAAEYKNGILTLDLPKMQDVKPETKRLEIK